MAEQVLIVGAGIVGTCCGIELAEAGYSTVLVDPDLPGRKASHWNAGVLSTSSLVPFNRPGLARHLPRLLSVNPGEKVGHGRGRMSLTAAE